MGKKQNTMFHIRLPHALGRVKYVVCFSRVLSKERNKVLDSFWHLLSTRGRLSHREKVQTWEVSWAASCIHTGSLSSPNMCTLRGRRHRGPSRVRVWAALCQQRVEERGGWKKRKKNTPSSWDDSTKWWFILIFYSFLYLSTRLGSVVPSAVFNVLYFFLIEGVTNCKQLFSAQESHSLLNLFLGAQNSEWF